MPPRRRAGGGGDAAGSGAANESAAADARPIFLTVGTTSFDALVAAADTPAFLATCAAKGYTSLTIQARAHAFSAAKMSASCVHVRCGCN